MIDINTINATPQSIIKMLNITPGFPFKELLPTEAIENALINIEYRSRLYTPDTTVWCLLSRKRSGNLSITHNFC